MSPEQINVAIAEACGFSDIIGGHGFHQKMSDEKSKECGGRWRFSIPDYHTDLNACAKMEKWLRGTDEQYHNDPVIHERWRSYQDYLTRKFGVSAPAPDRCEVFLKVLGLWKEDA